MKGVFKGKVEAAVEIEQNSLIINDRTVSLRACAALSPSMLAVLEELAKPESDGGVFRIQHKEGQIHLTKIGVMGHATALLRGRK